MTIHINGIPFVEMKLY